MKTRTTKNSTRRILSISCAMLLVLASLLAPSALMQQQGGPYTLNPTVVAGGGGTSTNAATKVAGTIGQGVLGLSSGGNYSLNAGFWQAGAPCAAVGISSQPNNQTTCAGSAANFSVTTSGTVASYQWRKNGVNLSNTGNISGATSAQLTINPAGPGDAASYDVVVNGQCGGAPLNSAAATLAINGYQLSSTGQQFPAAGGAGSFNVTTAASCSWTAMSNAPWIILANNNVTTGNGTVQFTVQANAGGGRSGTLTVADQTFTVTQSSPTAITLMSFAATVYDDGVFIEWQTGFEADNLGFNLYSDEGGKLSRLNWQLLAGSALKFGQRVTLGSGYSYSWWDNTPAAKATQYWLEDIDLDGHSTWHSTTAAGSSSPHPAKTQQARALASLVSTGTSSVTLAPKAALASPTEPGLKLQATIAGGVAVKVVVKQTGYYHLSGQDLVQAGLDPTTDPRLLQLFVDGRQLPIAIKGNQDGRLDSSDAVEFYGLGTDSPFSEAHIYWLVAGHEQGLRLPEVMASAKSNPGGSFPCTVERRDRTLYFSALRNGDAENFFGAVLASEPLNQILNVKHLDASETQDAILEVAMQGVTEYPHQLTIQFNDSTVGYALYQGQGHSVNYFKVPASLLREGPNTVTLKTAGAPADVSLVDYLRLTYQRSYRAAGDVLRFTAPGQRQITVNGFSNQLVRVFDVTDADAPQELHGSVNEDGASFALSLQVPGIGQRSLLALTEQQVRRDAGVVAEQPSNWHSAANGADLVIITRQDLMGAGQELKLARQAQGLTVAVVDIEDLYDEFSYGQKRPEAVRDFLAYAKQSWKKPIRFALFVGDASYDPKNYLGLGDSDVVPSRLLDTGFMEAASDDWLADFNNDGIADLAIGRLPACNETEAETMIAKILLYDRAAPADETLLVADSNDGFDFEGAIDQLRSLVPAGVRAVEIKRGQLGDGAAKATLIDAINRGQRMVSYSGHGSLDNWRGSLLSASDMSLLTNKDHLPVFVMMTCLNGHFNDPSRDSLSESLMKRAQGGAVAVWASSAMTYPDSQSVMNQELYRLLSGGGTMRLGEAVIKAKAAIVDLDVRRTWILFGDPTMRVK